MRVTRVLEGALLLCALGTGAGRAQDVEFSLAALGCQARDRVVFRNLRETLQGPCGGGIAYLKLGPLVMEASGFRAPQLQPSGSTGFTRDGGDARALVGIAPVPWVVFEGGLAVRAFSSAGGYQRWDIRGGGVKLGVPLGDPTLTAYARVHYLPGRPQRIPAGQVSGDAEWDFGVVAESGLKIAPRRLPLVFGVFYRMERFDFPGGTAGRLEQFDVLAIYGGLRLAK